MTTVMLIPEVTSRRRSIASNEVYYRGCVREVQPGQHIDRWVWQSPVARESFAAAMADAQEAVDVVRYEHDHQLALEI